MCEGRINCPSGFVYVRIRPQRPHDTVATNSERASNLTFSQSFCELAIRLAEKESVTLFLSGGISPPPDRAKISKIFDMHVFG